MIHCIHVNLTKEGYAELKRRAGPSSVQDYLILRAMGQEHAQREKAAETARCHVLLDACDKVLDNIGATLDRNQADLQRLGRITDNYAKCSGRP